MSETAYAQAEGLLEGEPKTSRSKPKNLHLTRARVARVVRRKIGRASCRERV